jgi:hypothetical protein
MTRVSGAKNAQSLGNLNTTFMTQQGLPLEELHKQGCRCWQNGCQGQRLKAWLLGRSIKLFAAPTKPRVTRTHPPWTSLGEALIALLGESVSYSGNEGKGVNCDVQCDSTQFMSTGRSVAALRE